jgi:hypothetical protein
MAAMIRAAVGGTAIPLDAPPPGLPVNEGAELIEFALVFPAASSRSVLGIIDFRLTCSETTMVVG